MCSDWSFTVTCNGGTLPSSIFSYSSNTSPTTASTTISVIGTSTSYIGTYTIQIVGSVLSGRVAGTVTY